MSDFDGAAAVANHDELWYAQVGADDVRTMTLEQLDEAFQAGTIHERTYVCQVGSSKWETLAEVAGLESDGEAAAEEVSPAPVSGFAAAHAAQPLAIPLEQPRVMVAPAQPYGGMHLSTNSTAPVASDVGDMDVDVDVTPVEFRSKKSRTAVWIGALAVIGAVGFGVVRARTPATVELPPMPPGAALTPEPPVDLVGAVLAAAPPPAAPAAPVAAAALGEDTKKALAAADKSLASKQKAMQQRRQETRVAAPRKRAKTDQPFHKGGNRYDPLNSSL